MKTILTKFHLNISTYLFFIFSFLCGYFKQTILIFFIILFHECGHIIAIKLCHYKLLKVEFYPFGGMTKIDKLINSSLNKEILIALSGVLMQMFLMIISYFLFTLNYITKDSYFLFKTYNTAILLFNLIPIIPLDGSIIMHSLLEKHYPYEKSFLIYELISIFSLILFFLYNLYFHLDNYFICVVLITEFILLKKQKKFLINRFYLERYLRDCPYKKIENEKTKNIHVLKKETLHFFYEKERYIHEKELLKRKYQNLS